MSCSTATALQLLQEFQQVQAHRAELYSQLSREFRIFLGHGQEAVLARLMQQITPQFAAVSKQVITIEGNLRSAAVGRADLAGMLRQVQELERDKLRLTLSWQALRAAYASGQFSWQSAADRPHRSVAHSQANQQEQQQQLISMLQHVQLQAAKQQANGQCSIGGNGSDVDITSGDQQQQVEGFMTVKPGFYEQQLQRATAAATAAEAMPDSSSSLKAQTHQHHHVHGCCTGHGHINDPLESYGEPTEAEYNAAVKEALQELDKCVLGINDVLDEVQETISELQEESTLR